MCALDNMLKITLRCIRAWRTLPGRVWVDALALTLVAAGIAGCAALTPPASIRYLQSLPKGALQSADPHNVRVAVNLPQGVRITNLTANVRGAAKEDKVTAALQFVIVPGSDALASPPTNGTGVWTYYALSRGSMKDFEKVQSFASRHPPSSDEPTTITVKIHNKLELANCNRRGKVPLIAGVLLDPHRGYVVLWNENDPLSHLASSEERICVHGSG